MQMKSLAFGIALLTSVSVGPALVGAQAAPVKARTTVESRTTWPAGSVEAASILACVKARSPGYAPITSGGDISIVRRQIEPQPLTRTSSDPTVELPASGRQGEAITVTSRQADGSIETWAHTGIDSGWMLVEYHFKRGSSPESMK